MTTQLRVTKHVDFCAAHSIKGAGKCANKHGHNWHATITVDQISGELDERGFIVDVRDLKDAAFKYDHDDLDKYFEYPSTENVAQTIADDALEICKETNPKAVYIINVQLIETANNSANASASNFKAEFPTQAVGLVGQKSKTLEQQMKDAHDAEASYQYGGTTVPSPSRAKFVKRSS